MTQVIEIKATPVTFNGESFFVGDAEITVEGSPENGGSYIRQGDKVVVGYLSHDDEVENPLHSDCGAGLIFSAHRNSSTHAEMQTALGLDSDWNPNYGHEAVEDMAAKLALAGFLASKDHVREAKDFFGVSTKEEVSNCLWRDYLGPLRSYRNDLTRDFEGAQDTDFFLEEAHTEAKKQGLVGNPFVVKLDVYEHGQTSYSVSGTGMQCRFDTARGGAVWIPSAMREQELWGDMLRANAVEIIETTAAYEWVPCENGQDYGSGVKKSYVETAKGFFTLKIKGRKVDTFPTFEGAKKMALLKLGKKFDFSAAVALVQPQLAKFAADACETYSDWVNGNCYHLTVETWKLNADGDDAEMTSSENTGGYVGSDYADDELERMMAVQLAAE